MYRPELLLHPNVPKPLHGVNPRSLLGDAWWNEQRQKAYAVYDFHCWCCSIHKSATPQGWLEAHEVYDYDYPHGRAVMTEIVALCRACHNFIHNGRQAMILQAEEITWKYYQAIMERGWRIIKANRLPQNPYALASWHSSVRWMILKDRQRELPTWWEVPIKLMDEYPVENDEDIAPWSEWRLVIDGVEYPPKFPTLYHWMAHYSKMKTEDE